MSKFQKPAWLDNGLVRWVDHRLPVFSFMSHELYEYPTPRNLNYWWNFGSLAGIVLVIMIVTGITLAMHYTPSTAMAFDSVERIMRDVNYGWLIRYIHMNGASMFFIVIYIHIFRGLYFWVVQGATRNSLDAGRRDPTADDGDCLYGLCTSLGANELLGCDSDH